MDANRCEQLLRRRRQVPASFDLVRARFGILHQRWRDPDIAQKKLVGALGNRRTLALDLLYQFTRAGVAHVVRSIAGSLLQQLAQSPDLRVRV